MTPRIYIGTSGWIYKEWAQEFYRGVKAREYLEFYTTQFSTVEINATFYRLPTLKVVHDWGQKVPEEFVFAVKGSRYITHMKRLLNLGCGVIRFFRRLQPLQSKTGAVLWQLPANFKNDVPRLRRFLQRLPTEYHHAFEFRDRSWLNDETKELLQRFNAAFVSVSSLTMPMDLSVTADFVYIRFHGLRDGPRHDYTGEELAPWAEHIRAQSAEGRRVFAYFNNDLNVRAPNNARQLVELCAR